MRSSPTTERQNVLVTCHMYLLCNAAIVASIMARHTCISRLSGETSPGQIEVQGKHTLIPGSQDWEERSCEPSPPTGWTEVDSQSTGQRVTSAASQVPVSIDCTSSIQELTGGGN